jgi:hypothetical protein
MQQLAVWLCQEWEAGTRRRRIDLPAEPVDDRLDGVEAASRGSRFGRRVRRCVPEQFSAAGLMPADAAEQSERLGDPPDVGSGDESADDRGSESVHRAPPGHIR